MLARRHGLLARSNHRAYDSHPTLCLHVSLSFEDFIAANRRESNHRFTRIVTQFGITSAIRASLSIKVVISLFWPQNDRSHAFNFGIDKRNSTATGERKRLLSDSPNTILSAGKTAEKIHRVTDTVAYLDSLTGTSCTRGRSVRSCNSVS